MKEFWINHCNQNNSSIYSSRGIGWKIVKIAVRRRFPDPELEIPHHDK